MADSSSPLTHRATSAIEPPCLPQAEFAIVSDLSLGVVERRRSCAGPIDEASQTFGDHTDDRQYSGGREATTIRPSSAVMAKVEVQIRSCFCCGLSLATVFVALYTLVLYSLLTGLAGWGLSDTANNGDASHFRSCELEAQGKLAAGGPNSIDRIGHKQSKQTIDEKWGKMEEKEENIKLLELKFWKATLGFRAEVFLPYRIKK
ncbi:unnamed protein product [Nippostrongylus brasiliensis]|uniref:Uncharacterized protein n=1 Tax=Nippostrongylus brasiliensis TaxID=27835 RepID=A0A0N4YUN8_NIPBR|nr:unnamed protein product [Nippostrongylus brasiliensis]